MKLKINKLLKTINYENIRKKPDHCIFCNSINSTIINLFNICIMTNLEAFNKMIKDKPIKPVGKFKVFLKENGFKLTGWKISKVGTYEINLYCHGYLLNDIDLNDIE